MQQLDTSKSDTTILAGIKGKSRVVSNHTGNLGLLGYQHTVIHDNQAERRAKATGRLCWLKVCIHDATSYTTVWTKRFEYSFDDQTRHIVYCPHSCLAVTQ